MTGSDTLPVSCITAFGKGRQVRPVDGEDCRKIMQAHADAYFSRTVMAVICHGRRHARVPRANSRLLQMDHVILAFTAALTSSIPDMFIDQVMGTMNSFIAFALIHFLTVTNFY